MSNMTAKSAKSSQLDLTQVHDLYKSYVNSLGRRDLKGLSDVYDPNAVIIANRELSRHTRSTGLAGGAKVEAFFQAYLDADVSLQEVWEYVQGTGAFLVRSRAEVRGVEKDTFDYFVLRNGKIWRHVSGIEEERTRTLNAQVQPSKIHPLFMKLVKGLQSHDVDELAKAYAPTAVCLLAANKSWGFRARGAVEGRDEIRSFLDSYVKAGGTMMSLVDYVQHGDTVYVHGLMNQSGVVTDSRGAYVIENEQIVVSFGIT